ncbi:MAG: hypothetical protein ABIW47_11925 [Ginsengibacter sp.]
MTLKKSIVISFISIIFFSCSDHVLDNKKKEQSEIKTKIIDSLSSKYGIFYRWDTLDGFKNRNIYTIDFNKVIKSNYQIIEKFRITDIYDVDSVKHVSIVTGIIGSFYLDFVTSEYQRVQLAQKDKDFILVVSIPELKKIKYVIEPHTVGKENEFIDLNIHYSQKFIGKGKIIDIISVNKLNKE